jgi:hypothetical protein
MRGILPQMVESFRLHLCTLSWSPSTSSFYRKTSPTRCDICGNVFAVTSFGGRKGGPFYSCHASKSVLLWNTSWHSTPHTIAIGPTSYFLDAEAAKRQRGQRITRLRYLQRHRIHNNFVGACTGHASLHFVDRPTRQGKNIITSQIHACF